jgi:hypothetical protein
VLRRAYAIYNLEKNRLGRQEQIQEAVLAQ